MFALSKIGLCNRTMLNLTNGHVANRSHDVEWLVDYMQQVDEADDAIWILTSTFTIFTMQSGKFGNAVAGKGYPNKLHVFLQ